MFNPSRDQSRDFLFDVWAKHAASAPLSALESMALAIVLDHPEYHATAELAPEVRSALAADLS